MIKTLGIGASALNANQTYIDSAANNIANVNTDEYKAERTRFTDLLYNYYYRGTTYPAPTVDEKATESSGNGVRIGEVKKVFEPGTIKETSNSMDLAIDGAGFIKVISPDGEELFSRGGVLKVNSDGVIEDAAGNIIEPEIQLPEGLQNFSISPSGQVTVINGAGMKEEIANISIYNFINPAGLIAQDNKLYLQTEQSGEAAEGAPGTDGYGSLRQGFTEMSNVDLIQEMVRLIEAQRAYEINARSIKTADDMWGMANSLSSR
ncbi:protein of unknown function DUF1078 domain protein [Desulfofarcimen acetoxidans DSM 771]|uniref:Uncharacterized protein n=1 Tax=Desulfofarcimen acetoxidans (strain ATCC 49208 / DSM 771 / KCTC 5769 / VKM B-1644 / 5575) TaxID=485916 RepID=C8W1I0_DESAS|nr:flagellar hook-basal body complex protein [Desulfofarcimen acetoxidans]ACV61625.1 protein of unknown function DUF1078 domain protein [Desulfofarcimen acetoxidans DSM 771]